jgi:hypothetical protein
MMDEEMNEGFSCWQFSPGRCAPGRHSLLVVHRKSWRTLFRKRYVLRCWHCDLRIPEPSRLRGNWLYDSGHGIMAPSARQG